MEVACEWYHDKSTAKPPVEKTKCSVSLVLLLPFFSSFFFSLFINCNLIFFSHISITNTWLAHMQTFTQPPLIYIHLPPLPGWLMTPPRNRNTFMAVRKQAHTPVSDITFFFFSAESATFSFSVVWVWPQIICEFLSHTSLLSHLWMAQTAKKITILVLKLIPLSLPYVSKIKKKNWENAFI